MAGQPTGHRLGTVSPGPRARRLAVVLADDQHGAAVEHRGQVVGPAPVTRPTDGRHSQGAARGDVAGPLDDEDRVRQGVQVRRDDQPTGRTGRGTLTSVQCPQRQADRPTVAGVLRHRPRAVRSVVGPPGPIGPQFPQRVRIGPPRRQFGPRGGRHAGGLSQRRQPVLGHHGLQLFCFSSPLAAGRRQRRLRPSMSFPDVTGSGRRRSFRLPPGAVVAEAVPGPAVRGDSASVAFATFAARSGGRDLGPAAVVV